MASPSHTGSPSQRPNTKPSIQFPLQGNSTAWKTIVSTSQHPYKSSIQGALEIELPEVPEKERLMEPLSNRMEELQISAEAGPSQSREQLERSPGAGPSTRRAVVLRRRKGHTIRPYDLPSHQKQKTVSEQVLGRLGSGQEVDREALRFEYQRVKTLELSRFRISLEYTVIEQEEMSKGISSVLESNEPQDVHYRKLNTLYGEEARKFQSVQSIEMAIVNPPKGVDEVTECIEQMTRAQMNLKSEEITCFRQIDKMIKQIISRMMRTHLPSLRKTDFFCTSWTQSQFDQYLSKYIDKIEEIKELKVSVKNVKRLLDLLNDLKKYIHLIRTFEVRYV